MRGAVLLALPIAWLAAACPDRHAWTGEDNAVDGGVAALIDAGEPVAAADAAAPPPDDAGSPAPDAACGATCVPRVLVTLHGAGGADFSYPTMAPGRFGIRYASPSCGSANETVGDTLAVDTVGTYVLDESVDPRFPLLVACMTDGIDQDFCVTGGPEGDSAGTCTFESQRLGIPDLWPYVITEARLVVTSLVFAPTFHAEAKWQIWGHPTP